MKSCHCQETRQQGDGDGAHYPAASHFARGSAFELVGDLGSRDDVGVLTVQVERRLMAWLDWKRSNKASSGMMTLKLYE